MKKSEQTFEKKKGRWSEQNKKSTFRAFASRANKPFAGKFARDWKKSLKIVSLEKNFANKDSDFGSMFLELLFEPGKFATDWKKSMKIVSLDIKIESMIWYEVIWRNWRKGSGKEDGRKKEKKYF